jgi:hypothetical protein
MHHADDDAEKKIPSLEGIEQKYEKTFKREIKECYEMHSSNTHDFAYRLSDTEEENPNYTDLTYTDYDSPANVARIIGNETLHTIYEVKTKLKNNLE